MSRMAARRVARRFVLLLEPGYELANEEARNRMDFHGYCRNLPGEAAALGYEVLDHRLFPFTPNPLNPTAVTVIRKGTEKAAPGYVYACPKTGAPLQEIGGMLFSPEALVVYPVIAGIPCLRIQNGILASKYPEVASGDADSLRSGLQTGARVSRSQGGA